MTITSDSNWQGQVAEFDVWAALLARSKGQLHPFLSDYDCGVDGVIHNLNSGQFTAVQVKSRSTEMKGEIDLAITDHELTIPHQLIVVVRQNDEGGLIDPAFVFPVELFIAHSAPVNDVGAKREAKGRRAYLPLDPKGKSVWMSTQCSVSELARKLGGLAPDGDQPVGLTPSESERHAEGRRGEVELVGLLAQDDDLNVFRAKPDCEFAEYAVLHIPSGNIIGIQVKSGSVNTGRRDMMVTVERATFVPNDNLYLVVFCETVPGTPGDNCLLIPASDIPNFAHLGSYAYEFRFDPNPTRATEVDPYRLVRSQLAGRISGLVGG